MLRKLLGEYESEMEHLAYSFHNGETNFVLTNESKVLEIADKRCNILNRLFEMHFGATDNDLLITVNSNLEEIEKKLISEHNVLWRSLQSLDEKFTLRTTLFYDFDEDYPNFAIIPNDDYYGSNWTTIHDIITSYMSFSNANEVFECNDGGYTPYTDGWRVYTSRFPDLPDSATLDICYTFYQLLAFQHFSIPDVLKMNSFSYRQEPLLYKEIKKKNNDQQRLRFN